MQFFSHQHCQYRKQWVVFGTALLLGASSHATVSVTGIPPGATEEYFSGGRQGTVFNTTSRCLEMPSPAITSNEELAEKFRVGEFVFDADYVTDPEAPYGGVGPIYINTSCRNCHPNYGRARRVESYTEQFGNGYTTFVHTPDGKLVDGYMFMLQTMATPPYEPLAQGVDLQWREYVDEFGNQYPDGTPYNEGTPLEGTLIYPVADLIDPLLPLPDDYMVSIEATIGLYGTGLLDAIPDEDIIAEYERQQLSLGAVKGQHGPWVTEKHDGKKHLGKFTWHNRRATLLNGPGANGVWSVPNITRADRPELFASDEWIDKQGELGHPMDVLRGDQPIEMTDEQLENVQIWFSGLAVPAARNLNDSVVKRGKELFMEAKCNECHKPSWVTGKSDIVAGYEKQKIWPYTDMLMHDMGKENCIACHHAEPTVCQNLTVPSLREISPITEEILEERARANHGIKTMNHGFDKIYRTSPLWARGLMKNAVDHTDMWHDVRARNFEEAILWHYGEGLQAREAFRNMSKADREALLKFLNSI